MTTLTPKVTYTCYKILFATQIEIANKNEIKNIEDKIKDLVRDVELKIDLDVNFTVLASAKYVVNAGDS